MSRVSPSRLKLLQERYNAYMYMRKYVRIWIALCLYVKSMKFHDVVEYLKMCIDAVLYRGIANETLRE